MPQYRKAEIEGIGEISFYGNAGAVAEYEDKKGVSIGQVFQSPENVKITDILSLVYECHLIACIRLRKDPIDFKTMKAFSESIMPLYPLLIEDILNDMGIGEGKAEKKTK